MIKVGIDEELERRSQGSFHPSGMSPLVIDINPWQLFLTLTPNICVSADEG